MGMGQTDRQITQHCLEPLLYGGGGTNGHAHNRFIANIQVNLR